MKSDLVSEQLQHLLATSYMLYVKTHNFHWNVVGPRFKSLHALFEEQYTDLAEAVDEIAERIRMLGDVAPGSFSQFSKLSVIQDAPDVPPSADDMLKTLIADHTKVVELIEKVRGLADEAEDSVTMGLMDERQAVHEKTLWMMRVSVE